jgi:hypothetical protein
VAKVTGEIELEEKVLVIRRIHVKFELRADDAVFRSLRAAIAITSEVLLLPG